MTLSPSPFLRQALLADAVTSALCGLSMLLAATPLHEMLGLPEGMLRIAGATLLPFAAFAAYLSLRPRVHRLTVWAVVLANALWAVDSALLLVSGWLAPTVAGTVFVIVQAVMVLMYAELQVMGMRRSTAAAAM